MTTPSSNLRTPIECVSSASPSASLTPLRAHAERVRPTSPSLRGDALSEPANPVRPQSGNQCVPETQTRTFTWPCERRDAHQPHDVEVPYAGDPDLSEHDGHPSCFHCRGVVAHPATMAGGVR